MGGGKKKPGDHLIPPREGGEKRLGARGKETYGHLKNKKGKRHRGGDVGNNARGEKGGGTAEKSPCPRKKKRAGVKRSRNKGGGKNWVS